MLLKKIKITFFILTILFLSLNYSIAKISEWRLRKYSSIFLSKLIEENPDFEKKIRICFNGIVRDGNAGIRLHDKFGLFLYELQKKNISILKSRFFYINGTFSLFIVMMDEHDEQLYTMYVEYEYIRRESQCILRDIYFSIVFEERIRQIKKFFEFR